MLFQIATVIILACLESYSAYNTNRQIVLLKDKSCGFYDNPVFQVNPNFLQNRMKQDVVIPEVIFVDNRLRKDSPYYRYQKESPASDPKIPVSFFPNMKPLNLVEFQKSDPISQSQEDAKEDEVAIDYDKLWRVGEIPPSRMVQALPDVYVKPDGDAPPIVDMMSMEKSELTEESHDLENVEIQEKILSDPLSATREVIIERVTTRPEPSSTENPALLMFKEIDLSKKPEPKVAKEKKHKKKEEVVTEATAEEASS